VAIALRQIPWHRQRPAHISEVPSPSVMEWNTLRQWFHAEAPTALDLFGHAPISGRISRVILGRCGQSIALLGPFGSGKSSILARVRATLERSTPATFVIAEFNGWAIPQAADAPRVALERVVEALSHIADVQAYRSLPESYKRLIAAEPSGLVAKLLGSTGEYDPLVHLKSLEPFLEAVDAQVVLFVEDADRAGSEFETRHLERLLNTLREVQRVSFVLSIDGSRGPKFDYRKLCDVIEVVPKLSAERVFEVLSVAYRSWMDQVVLDPRPRRESVLYLDQEPNELLKFYRRAAKDSPVHMLTALMQSPRRLKHMLRRVDRVWTNLAGEVDLDDLIVVSALRELDDPRVFEFLAENIDLLREQ
jgi:hypothetical protein